MCRPFTSLDLDPPALKRGQTVDGLQPVGGGLAHTIPAPRAAAAPGAPVCRWFGNSGTGVDQVPRWRKLGLNNGHSDWAAR